MGLVTHRKDIKEVNQMNFDFLMFVFLVMAAVYVVFHIVDVFKWWYDKAKMIVKGVWNLIKSIFKKKV